MENLLCIKGKIIGKGKPLVCVPVMESSKEEILRETRRLEEAHTEMIEWRVDAFENVESPNAIREILNEMKHIIKESILVYTFRSKNQGGCKALSAADIYDIHQVAAESDVVDFIDVEYFEAKNPQKEIAMLREMGAYVIASHHDFEQTPDPEVIRMLLEQIRESGADVVKLAVMPLVKKDGLPEKAREVIDSLKFHFHCQYDEKDSIGKRYRRQDAIGTPFCITVDHETPNDHKVTLRYRDTMEQERVAISDLRSIIEERVSITSVLKKLGKEIKNF